ncbi:MULTISPECIES: ABC transporter substrate-binding protein [Clostridium]|jgi:arginine/lysine/histidine transporter system substrate-binding protein|uniref:Arginine-binding extracellular protein ArtP n=2 Tax=Clostridium TaxID=1485 RepID=A0A151AM66_9CLOT|nr:arginine-binding extracellular protein ArtP precursor [Clostridium colicanis DSM 13634]MBE6044946.1 transporter substrate-binding domain-containing protein [Clostridium thermopalmarium]PRR76977.1 Arginine-binding extracellular protein ArtP precursor [Clostridium thermopalmarium DSM 5974]PVZ21214.1 amino acid ABC transporter substrate-binding protein (PAAT family) [Clostridium thermopalmarium DSM 5974]
MKKNILNKLVTLTLMTAMIFTFSACSKTKSPMERVKENGTLIVGTSGDYPPYEFHKKVNGEDKVVGFDIMIAEEIAKDLGVKLEIRDMNFEGLLGALKSNKVDMVIAGMNPTPERAKEVDFSKVYYVAKQAVLVRAEDKDKIKSLDDLKGKKVGVQLSSTQEEIAKSQIKDAEIKSLSKITDLILELKNKKVDALVVELPVGQSYADKNKDLSMSDIEFDKSISEKGSAIAVTKNNQEFLDSINKTLDRLMTEDKINQFIVDASNMIE